MKAIDCLIEGYREDQGRDGEIFSAAEQERYESGIIEEARQIAAGKSLKLSTAEHLRVLLSCCLLYTSDAADELRSV